MITMQLTATDIQDARKLVATQLLRGGLDGVQARQLNGWIALAPVGVPFDVARIIGPAIEPPAVKPAGVVRALPRRKKVIKP
jgi:hypothetical protein